MRHLWDFSLAIWQHRNDDILYGATNDAAKDKQEKTLYAKITAAYQQPEEHSDADRLVLFTKSLPDRLKTCRYASKVKWLSLRMHLIQAPDTPADPPPSRTLYNMFRPLAALMTSYTTTTPVPPSSSTNRSLTPMTRS